MAGGADVAVGVAVGGCGADVAVGGWGADVAVGGAGVLSWDADVAAVGD